MAVNTIDYKVVLDTSEVSTRMHEIRSQVSGALGNVQSDVSGAGGGLARFGHAASSGASMMAAGFDRAGQSARTVGSFMDPMMAFESHYGTIRAESSLAQEWAAYRGGAGAVAGFAPPGVGAGQYAQALTQNLSRRIQDTGAGFVAGAVPVAAGLAGWSAASAVVGGGFAGLAAGAVAGYAAEQMVSKGIEHGNKIFEEMGQLGEIFTAGRGFSTSEKFEFGSGMRDMAKRMNVSTNELGDMASGVRQMGMMPRSRDVSQSLEQFEGMAEDIRQVATGMQMSLGRATQTLRDVERMGLGRGAGGVFSAASTAEGLGTSLQGLISHVGMGQSVGQQVGIGASAGGGVFLQSAFAGGTGMGALTGQEQLMVGGAMGLGRTFGMHAVQNAMGPWGQMQMMAMMGPSGAEGLPGSAMGVMNQAAGNIFGGGDPIANMVEFTTNRQRMTGQLGATGIRQMQAQAIQSQAQMLMQMSPGLTEQRAYQFVGMQQGMGEHQSRAMAEYIGNGFRDVGPSRRAAGMPGAFAGGQGGRAAINAGIDSAARQESRLIKEETKMPWTRGIEWIGEKWADMRRTGAEHAAGVVEDRQRELGFVAPEAGDLAAVRQGMQSGTGMFGEVGVDLSAMGSRSGVAMQTVLAFGGAKPGGPGGILMGDQSVGAKEVGRSMGALGTQLGRLASGRLSSSTVTRAATMIGHRIAGDSFDVAGVAEKLDWNSTRATGGKDLKSLGYASHDIGQILQGTEFAKGFRKQGLALFGSEKGAEAMATINNFMQAQGYDGFDIGKKLVTAGATGMAGMALATRSKRTGLLSRLVGGSGTVEDEADKVVEQSRAVKDSVMMYSAGAPIAAGAMMSIPSKAAAMVTAEKTMGSKKDVDEAAKIVATKSFQEYVKVKGRVAPEIENAKRAEVMKAAFASNRPEAGRVAAKMLQTMNNNPKVAKELAASVDAMTSSSKKSKKSSSKGGRAVAFQSQAESFQGQVASALKKTAHTLEKVKVAMSAMESRLGKP